MIRGIRSGATGIFAYAMLGLLVISFTVWGIGDSLRGQGGSNTVATVGGQDIPTYLFDHEYRLMKENTRQMLGKRATPELLASLGLEQQVVKQLVTAELLRRETEALGMLPDDAEVLEEIRSDPNFQNELGVFDKARYQEFLKHNGVREAADIEQRRLRTGKRLLLSTLSAGAPVNDLMVKTLYAAQHEKRVADIIVLSEAQTQTPAVPEDKVLEAFYKEHTSMFMQPEQRTFSYLLIPEAQVAGDDEDTKVSKLSAKIQDMLAGGSTMEEVAKAIGAQAKTLGPIDAQGHAPDGSQVGGVPSVKDFLVNAFTLEEGSQSQLLQDKDGNYVMVQADKVQAAQPMPYAQAKPKLAAAWDARERARQLATMADEISRQLASGKDPQGTVLAEHKLAPLYSGELGRSSQKTDSGLLLPTELVEDIFTHAVGQPTSAFPAADGKYMLAVVRGRVAAKTPTPEEELEFRGTLSDATRSELLSAYLLHLQRKYPVFIRQDVLAAYAASPTE